MRIHFNAWRDLGNPRAGGSEILVDRLAQGLHDRGHQVSLLCGGPTAEHDYRSEDAGSTFGQYFRTPAIMRKRYADVDLVVDVSNGMSNFTPLFWSGPTLCLVHHVHTQQWGEHFPAPVAAFGRLLESQAMPRVYSQGHFAAMSPSTAQDLAALGIDPDCIRVLPDPIPAPTITGERSSEPLFVAVGRLAAHKRIDLLLDMWDQVRDQVGGRLLIVGTGPERERLEALAGPGVEFVGAVDELEKHRLFAAAWALLHPAAREGWGMVITEAGHHATPSIGFDVPGVRDAIRDTSTGLLAADPAQFMEHWLRLADDALLRRELGTGARLFAAGFSVEAMLDRFEELAAEAIAAHASATAGPAPLPWKPATAGKSIIVPAYNEAERIAPLLHELVEVLDHDLDEVIVVDDGSSDATAALARTCLEPMARARVVEHDVNQGKGAAIRTGVESVSTDRIIFMDADGSTDLAAIDAAVAALDDAEVVLGSRSAAGAVVDASPIHRVWMGRIFNRWVRYNTGLVTRDSQCGFKAFQTPAARYLFESTTIARYAFDVEVLELANRSGMDIIEVPVQWEGRDGSKVAIVGDTLNMVKDVYRIGRKRRRSLALRPSVPAAHPAHQSTTGQVIDLRDRPSRRRMGAGRLRRNAALLGFPLTDR